MTRFVSCVALCVGMAACTAVTDPEAEAPEMAPEAEMSSESGAARPEARPETLDTTPPPAPPPTARTVEQFDTTTAEERNEAVAEAAPEGGEVALGATVASLGSPTEAGFWLKTPLVSTPAKGKVVFAGTGKSVAVDLIPIDGPKTAGSRMSLAAMRLIGAPLTGLPEVQVFRVSG